jgi:tRNA(fMet)-specific endonuclease VapC
LKCWNPAAARHYAQIRTALERSGNPIGNMDMLIAAQARAEEAVLVTHDRVFRRVKGLKVEDWS